MPDPVPVVPLPLTAEQASDVAACVSLGSDEWITATVVIALIFTFPEHDWLSLTLFERDAETLRDTLSRTWHRNGPGEICTTDPRRDGKDDLRVAEAARVDALLKRRSIQVDGPTPPAPSFTPDDVAKAADEARRRIHSRTLRRQVDLGRPRSAAAGQLGLNDSEARRLLRQTATDLGRHASRFRPKDLLLQRAEGKISQAELLRGVLVYDYSPTVIHDAERGELSEWITSSETIDIVVARHLGLLTREELDYLIERLPPETGSSAPEPEPKEQP